MNGRSSAPPWSCTGATPASPAPRRAPSAASKTPARRSASSERAPPRPAPLPARGAMKIPELSPSWQAVLADEFTKPYFAELSKFVDAERKAHEVFPPEDEV